MSKQTTEQKVEETLRQQEDIMEQALAMLQATEDLFANYGVEREALMSLEKLSPAQRQQVEEEQRKFFQELDVEVKHAVDQKKAELSPRRSGPRRNRVFI
ncbi:hypothetical protein [Algicola sagamiensis]|uniref:hypothetical protein n=1 Tax=Algicola sagamiensis TaxID=163869 RepID=UPI00036D5749|nr:hypothetical protein [Algicola sagamiensis]